MKDFTLETLWAISAEMFGWMFWPLLVLAAVIALLLLVALVRRRGFKGWPARGAVILGVLAAIAAAAYAPAMTQASFDNLHGIVDWTFLALIAIGTFIAATLSVFAVFGTYFHRPKMN